MNLAIVVECCGNNDQDASKLLSFWRPRRDLNPCYRRERNHTVRNLLKLRSTDGHQSELQDPFVDHNWIIKWLADVCDPHESMRHVN